MSNILSREAILAARVVTTLVEVPEWNGSVHVRALSLRSRTALLDAIYANEKAHSEWKADQERPESEREGIERVDLYDQSILTVLFGIVEEDGSQRFTIDDHDLFADMDYPIIVNLWTAMNNLGRRDPEAVKKNSASTRRGASSSASRNRSVKQ